MKSFSEMFPDSANTLRVKHHRLFILKSKFLRILYHFKAPSDLIDNSKLITGSMPVIINNFNRLSTLEQLINWLETLTIPTSIVILDNGSTYRPLLDFYNELDAPNIQIIRLKNSNGWMRILPMSSIFKKFEKYVVTDADLIPYKDTPVDILEKMSNMLDKYPKVNHVGPSLEIEDIPLHYPLRNDVLEWESKFWIERNCPESFKAGVDTTMGMYRKSSLVTRMSPALRLDRPYRLKHVDWYLDPEDISEEHQYYIDHCSAISTWNTKLKRALSS